MWNGAVFMPLIEEIETIEPGLPWFLSSAATAWLMKKVVSRFAANSSRQSFLLTRVDGIQVAVGVPRLVDDRADPVVGRRVGGHWYDRQTLLRQRSDVFVEVLLRAADRDDGGSRLGRHPGHRGADAAAAGARHDDHAAGQPQEIHGGHIILSGQYMVLCILQNTIPQRVSRRQGHQDCLRRLLSGLAALGNVQRNGGRKDFSKTMTTPLREARYTAAQPPGVAEGWRLQRVTGPSRLFGANGLRTGPDGRVYVAQVTGSQISALDLETGGLQTVSPKGGDIIAPDDVAFDPDGNLYATEVMDGRVSVLDTAGRTRVLRDDVPSANGITFHRGRLFIGECREGGRLLEMDLNGGVPRVLLDNVPSPNAMEVGPDGQLYFPVMGANEVWRIDPEGGEPQRVAGDLGVPDSVKFDSEGFIVSTQVASGQVLRIDPRSGQRMVVAQLTPGLDNLTFAGNRLLVSNFTGEITEILRGGETRTVLPGGLNWPLDLAVGDDGNLYVADGTYFYVVRSDGALQTVGMLFSPGYPGFLRGLAPAGAGEFVVTTSGGQVTRYRPAVSESELLADGFDQLYGVAIARR